MTRFRTLAAAVGLSVFALLVLTSSAGATPYERPLVSAQSTAVFSSSLTTSARRLGFGPRGTADEAIDCFASIGDPYESKLVAGRASVIARVRCTKPMQRLGLRVNLHSRLVSVHRPLSKTATTFLKGSASLPCRPGTYRGTANVTLVFPRGYEPSPQRFNVFSRQVSLDCK